MNLAPLVLLVPLIIFGVEVVVMRASSAGMANIPMSKGLRSARMRHLVHILVVWGIQDTHYVLRGTSMTTMEKCSVKYALQVE